MHSTIETLIGKGEMWKLYHRNTCLMSEYSSYNCPSKYPEIKTNQYHILSRISMNKIKVSNFYDVLRERESTRTYADKKIDLNSLSSVLYYSNGKITYGDNLRRKVVPSAGARYPVELHIISFDVMDIENGIYHYNDNDHTLEMTEKGNFKDQAYRNCRFQEMVLECGCLICICLDFDRTISKYGERGYRYALLDAGHVAQNIYLTCTYENIGVAGIGGFYDKEINKMLKLPKEEEPIYLLSIGNKESEM